MIFLAVSWPTQTAHPIYVTGTAHRAASAHLGHAHPPHRAAARERARERMPATWASQEESLIGGSATQRHWTAGFCVSNAETSP